MICQYIKPCIKQAKWRPLYENIKLSAEPNKLAIKLRARCPSIFSSIAIELNIPRDDFSSIAIQLTFVILGHALKKAGSVLYDICAPGTRIFKSDYITRYLHTWVVLLLCIIFTIGESPRVCSKYIHWPHFLLFWGEAKYCDRTTFTGRTTQIVRIELCSRRTTRPKSLGFKFDIQC